MLCLMVVFDCPANAEDYTGPYRTYSAELENLGVGEITGWDQATFSKLSDEDMQPNRKRYPKRHLKILAGIFHNRHSF